MGRYIRGNVNETLSLGTLAALTLIVAGFDETVNERTFISSIKAQVSLADLTPGAGIGPILIGVAHGDYTAAEIEEWIETIGSWNEGDLVQNREVGKRLIRRFGVLGSGPQGGAGATALMNDGKPVTVKLGWILNQGTTLDLWAYNMGTVALATTNPTVHLEGHVNLWPR